MFIKINKNCIATIENIVWIDTSSEKWIVKLIDESEHCIDDESEFLKQLKKGR